MLPLPIRINTSAYAGIGSRSTPPTILELISNIATLLARCELTLRSGGASGADCAFEQGCDRAHGRKEIFLPWKGFNRNASPCCEPTGHAFEIASTIHPNWNRCNPTARRFHARNCHQILGSDLRHPVDFVLFWAPEKDGRVDGGTATAVHLARERNIPTFNLWIPEIHVHWIDLEKRQREV